MATRARSVSKAEPAPASTGAPVVGRPMVRKPAARTAARKAAPRKVVPRPASEPAAARPVPEKTPKLKLVRDSFTMPQADYAAIAALKKRAIAFLHPAKKSELLRAGLHALTSLGDVQLKAALEALTPIKTGRPKKH